MEKIDEIYEKVILQAEQNIERLKQKIDEFEQLKNDVAKLPESFDKKLKEISELENNYTLKLGISSGEFLQKNNELFTSKIDELTEFFIEIKKEIDRLQETDFVGLFKVLQDYFIKTVKTELNEELKNFDSRINDFQNNISNFKNRIGDLKTEITRLENIDLEKHFDKLQKTLSDIFGAINSLNTSFTTVIQTLNKIVQSNSEIETKIDESAKDIKIKIEKISDDFNKKLQQQNEIIKQNKEVLESKFEKIKLQNENLIKSIKTNRIITIIGIVVITTLFIIQILLK